MTGQDSKSTTKRNQKPSNGQTLISIANLMITGIIGIVIALMINDRERQLQLQLATQDEQVQTKLIELKTQLDRQSDLAHLTFTRPCLYTISCSGSMEVSNSGPA